MTVTETMRSRTSKRAYKPEQVSKAVLTEIFEEAAKTPSWANSQPWEVFVATGTAMERIRSAYAENYKNAVPTSAEVPRPMQWPEAAKQRQKCLRPDMVRDCGDAADQFGVLNQRVFDAPALIVLCLDKLYEHWGLYDVGAYSQSVMLLAEERGLSTIPAIMAVAYPDVVRRELNIPRHLKIAVGIAVGYADTDNKINNFQSSRSPISETVRFAE